MTFRSIKLTLATLALAASGGYAQAATYTDTFGANANSITFAGLGSPLSGFTGITTPVTTPVEGFTSVVAANGLSIDRGFQGFSEARIIGGAFTDKVGGAGFGTTYSFASQVVGFFGTFNMNPLNEDTNQNNAYAFVDNLEFTFFSNNVFQGSYILNGPSSNAGMIFDFGLRSDTGSFDKFVVTSLGNTVAAVGGTGNETFHVSNFQFAAAVPEPETYAMLLVGLGAVGFMSKRRRQIG
jgi:hypothetical protein